MPPKSAARASTIRLQSIPRLKVKSPMKYDKNPCLAAMTSLLNCWGTTGYSIQGCVALEQQLRECTDSNPPKITRKNTVNYHLARMFRMISPRGKKT